MIPRPSRKLLLQIALGIATAALLVLIVAFVTAPEATKVKVGQVAPDLDLPTSGGRTKISNFRGSPVLLVFFKSTCRLCREEMPALEDLQRRYGPRGLVILGVSVDTDDAALRSFIEQVGITFFVMRDPDAVVLRRVYGSYKMPEAYLLDKQGKVVQIFLGRADWKSHKTLGPIQRLLGIRMWPN